MVYPWRYIYPWKLSDDCGITRHSMPGTLLQCPSLSASQGWDWWSLYMAPLLIQGPVMLIVPIYPGLKVDLVAHVWLLEISCKIHIFFAPLEKEYTSFPENNCKTGSNLVQTPPIPIASEQKAVSLASYPFIHWHYLPDPAGISFCKPFR